MCVYSAYMSRVIAEYELHEPGEVKLSCREACFSHTKWWHHLWVITMGLLYNWRLLCFALVAAVLAFRLVSEWQEYQTMQQMLLPSIYMSEEMPDIEESVDMICYYLDKERDMRLGYELLLDIMLSMLLIVVYSMSSSYFVAMRRPYCGAMSIGLGSADVMRLTARGCLLVGRNNGLRMFFPWADYKSFFVGERHLSLRRSVWEVVLLPLPGLSREQQESLRLQLKDAFARSSAADSTRPPDSAHVWKGRKLAPRMEGADMYVQDAVLCKMITCAVVVISAVFLAVAWWAGVMPRLLLVSVALLLLGSRLVMVLIRSRRAWRYECRRGRYVVYPPFGGVCSVPWGLVSDIFLLKYQDSLRLKGDAYALLPCTHWWQGVEPLQDVPRTKALNRKGHVWCVFIVLLLMLALVYGKILIMMLT